MRLGLDFFWVAMRFKKERQRDGKRERERKIMEKEKMILSS
jgi:hypothetical protein